MLPIYSLCQYRIEVYEMPRGNDDVPITRVTGEPRLWIDTASLLAIYDRHVSFFMRARVIIRLFTTPSLRQKTEAKVLRDCTRCRETFPWFKYRDTAARRVPPAIAWTATVRVRRARQAAERQHRGPPVGRTQSRCQCARPREGSRIQRLVSEP